MADRKPRIQWSQDHRTHVYWAEKGIAGLAFLVGAYMAYNGSGIGSYTGVGVASVGAYMSFPSIRPILSKIVDRLPFLTKPTPDEPPEEEEL